MDCRLDYSEGSPTTENDACRWTGEESTEQCQRTFFVQHDPGMTAD